MNSFKSNNSLKPSADSNIIPFVYLGDFKNLQIVAHETKYISSTKKLGKYVYRSCKTK